MSRADEGKAQVLCAHESATILETMRRLVEEGGWEAVTTDDGDVVLELLREPESPAVLVVDVALPGRAGFELIDEIRRLNLATRTILIASVYNQTGYKRRPTTLYGADDYIEQHHLSDQLVPKLGKLMPKPVTRYATRRTRPPGDPGLDEDAARIRAAGLERFHFAPELAAADEAEFRARRLAWLILADILLYNGDEIAKWAKSGQPPERVKKDLDEGRELFAARVPPHIRGDRDFIGEALDSFLKNRRVPG